jgi:thiol:disulfide interchange protein DsbD
MKNLNPQFYTLLLLNLYRNSGVFRLKRLAANLKRTLKRPACRANYIRLIILTLLFYGWGFAQFGEKSHVQGKLISEVKHIKAGDSFWVATELHMEERWHIYWQNPGDTGLKTSILWELPEGVSASETLYPYPEKIKEENLIIYGYHDTIYLLNQITVNQAFKGDKIVLKSLISWLECAEVCIPGGTNLNLELPVTQDLTSIDETNAELFSNARNHLPLKESGWKFNAVIEDSLLKIQAAKPNWFKGEIGEIMFYPYIPGWIDNLIDQNLLIEGDFLTLTVSLKAGAAIPEKLEGILVAEDGWRGNGSEKAVEVMVTYSENLSTSSASQEISSIWIAILFSFLGGIILNLMPCVLPVLSIKIMGIIQQAHDEHTQPWQHGWMFTAGVLVSFWILAGALLILKAGGAELGWGFQLQEPIFIIFLAVFMFIFGLTMFGVFEMGTSLTTVEGKTGKKSGFLGSFISGVTATIVATPCTAPFMGSALGFALTQPAWASLLVFTFLGLGMAAPFILISSIPALLKYIPKPGRWMESLKQFMGFLLVATVIWLLWVLGMQAGANLVIIVLFSLLFTAISAWIYGRWGHLAMPKLTRIKAILIALIILIATNGWVFLNADDFVIVPNNTATANKTGIQWENFNQGKVDQLVRQGKPVFIDFTAAWCLSCQVNEQIAFSLEEVQNKFKELGITAFKADWTNRDEMIAKALAKFGRNSVPLYVLYTGKKNAEPYLLPEIISPDIVLDALKRVH